MRKWIVCAAVVLCCLMGCGKPQEVKETKSEQPEASGEYVTEYRLQEKTDLFHAEWKAEEAENAETYFRQEKYIAPLFEGKPDNGWSIEGVGWGDFFYSGYTVYGENSCLGFYVDRLNLDTLETERIPYSGEKGGPFYLVCDGEQLYGVFEFHDRDGFVEAVELTALLPDGSFGESIDLFPVAREQDILPKEAHYAFQMTIHYCAEKQVVYLIPFEGTALYVIGKDGELQYRFTGFGEGESEISLCAVTYEGDGIFRSYDKASRESTYFMYDSQGVKKQFSEPGALKLSQDKACCDAYGNILYLENQSNIVSWNVETGKRERLYCGSRELFQDLQFLARTKEGKLILISDDMNGMSLSVYSASGPAQQVEIVLETALYMPYELKTKIQQFERTHPGVTFRLGEELENYTDYELRITKLYQEFADGNGPDCLLMRPEDMERFANNGVLMDMSGVIDQEELCILPGVLDCGRIDNRQYLFPLSAEVSPLVVKKSVWDKPSWTVSEVLEVLEKQEKEVGEEFSFSIGTSAQSLLVFFIKDLEHSPFLNTDSMTCSFDGELFERVLETCKYYGEKSNARGESYYADTSEKIRDLREGKTLAAYPGMFSFDTFSRFQAGLKDDCNWVGYPTDSGNGNFLYGGLGIAINSATEHREILEEFIRCLYSFDYLLADVSMAVPLRTDILEKNVIEKCDWTNDIVIRTGRRTYSPVQGKKQDGTSYKNEYMEYLRSCRSGESPYRVLTSMILEDAEPYFLGQKSVSEVQKLIQNRVTLYLNENK